MHLRSELIHPAFRERGRAIPQPQVSAPKPTPRVVEGRVSNLLFFTFIPVHNFFFRFGLFKKSIKYCFCHVNHYHSALLHHFFKRGALYIFTV